MIQMSYNGIDITGDVSINRCWHDMYAGGRPDTISLRMNDVSHLWDSWGPSPGDEIKVSFDTISTGTLFLTESTPQNGLFQLLTQSAPLSGYEKRRKSWQRVWLLQIAQEIAERNGLEFTSYGVTDQLYHYIPQDDVGDFAFLAELARAESCSFTIFDKRLILYAEPFLEALEPSETLTVGSDGDYRYNDLRSRLYGSCVVVNGQYTGTFSADNGSALVYHPKTFLKAGSGADAVRFAQGFLRSVNKSCMGGFVRLPTILSGYAAGSMLNLETERAASWNGPVFLDHVRNDYAERKSKLFFRKPLEGY